MVRWKWKRQHPETMRYVREIGAFCAWLTEFYQTYNTQAQFELEDKNTILCFNLHMQIFMINVMKY
jgi:hypothetical protein